MPSAKFSSSEQAASLGAHGLLWFGAAVSLAEIMTGALLAPLGFARGMTAIVLGHVLGCLPLFAAGLIGARTGLGAMRGAALAFGQLGARFFALLNLVQLLGWTAVMIASGAACAQSLAPFGAVAWGLLLGALILVWVALGLRKLRRLNLFTMSGLFLLTLFMSLHIFHGPASVPSGEISFGAALELSAAMPLSWLPLIADYTRNAQRPAKVAGVSACVYGLTSCWMFAIGLGAALFAGSADIANVMAGLGFGTIALLIAIFSTVTTTFLDVHSAGASANCLLPVPERGAAAAVCLLGTLIAITLPLDRYEDFLYLIASAFAPMIAILVTEHFLLRHDFRARALHGGNFLLWLAGVALYQIFLHLDTPLGNTLPVMLLLAATRLLLHVMSKKK